jgi:hypothetical protein
LDTKPAESVNPFAGSHPITSDPVELEAVRLAAEAALREFPYFEERFGERARLFGTSDGAWLATLPGHSAGYVREQVLWLGAVLANRGMPRLLLERHLELLHAELVRLRPDRGERYAALLDAAALLRERRESRIAPADARAIEAAFEEQAGAGWRERLPGMGSILVAAAADEADGLTSAVGSVLEWALDPARFAAPWLLAVRTAIGRARAAASPADPASG